jgi:hypothetical protein
MWNPTLRENFVNARNAGLAGCTYHWLKPGNARDQMKHYLATIEPERGERVISGLYG